MITDIDRLHDVFLGNTPVHTGGVAKGGETFAKCHVLAGVVEVGSAENIVCPITTYKDIYYIRKMIEEVFIEHNLEISQRRATSFLCNGKRVFFISRNQGDDYKLMGLGEYNIVSFER